MGKEEDKFGLLPVISEAVSEKIFGEMDEFKKLSEAAKGQTIAEDMNWLAEHNEQVRAAIEGLVEGVINIPSPVAEKLTHLEWENLKFDLIYAELMLLRALNEARREQIG